MAGKAPGRNTVGDAGDATDPYGPGGSGGAEPLTLVVADPSVSERGARLRLAEPTVLIGRAPDNDLVLDESSVSARHARIDVEPDGAFVTDLGSTNGTYVDGRRITGSVALTAGCTLQLGRCDLLVEAGDRDGTPRAADGAHEPARRGTVIPARRALRLLVSFDPADAAWGERIVSRLERIGHTVLVDRDTAGDGWAGRLLDAVWSCDAALFVVSDAAGASARIHREVHLAAAEHTRVVPVLVGGPAAAPEGPPAGLPDDLAYYLVRGEPVDLRVDLAAGLSELQARLDLLPTKRVARPWQLARRIALALVVLLLVLLAYRFVTG